MKPGNRCGFETGPQHKAHDYAFTGKPVYAGAKATLGVSLESRPIFLFSPSVLQASFQTSTVHAGNRTIGAAMSLIKKIDVKEHFDARRAIRLAEDRSIGKPDAAGIPEIKAARTETIRRDFIEDFSVEHSSSGPVPLSK